MLELSAQPVMVKSAAVLVILSSLLEPVSSRAARSRAVGLRMVVLMVRVRAVEVLLLLPAASLVVTVMS